MDAERLPQFFKELNSRLDMAREVDERLNAAFAYRFNVLDYIRTSELGLSRVIADLLDPRATHGQKTLFLDTLLRDLQRSSAEQGRLLDLTRGFGDQWRVAEESVDVKVERTIRGGRRLDISVEFRGSDKQLRCLAIENKPYAGDQNNQIHDYLGFLEKKYGDSRPTNHLLIYLSPTGGLPSEQSVTKARLDKEVTERDFAVMGYWMEGDPDSNEDEDDSRVSRLLLKYSLADWFVACRKQCDVDRLRNFLRDAEAFCGQHFGDADMPETTQIETAIAFIRRDRENAQVAQLVAQAFPTLRDRVQRRIYEEVEKELRKVFKPPQWNVMKHRGRLRLHEKGHASRTEFSGVWLMWHDNSTLTVGVEWPRKRGTSLDEGVQECFLTAGVEAGQRKPGGGSGRPTWWFAGRLAGDKWVGWDHLLAMKDEEFRRFARATGNFMTRLAEVLDRVENT